MNQVQVGGVCKNYTRQKDGRKGEFDGDNPSEDGIKINSSDVERERGDKVKKVGRGQITLDLEAFLRSWQTAYL